MGEKKKKNHKELTEHIWFCLNVSSITIMFLSPPSAAKKLTKIYTSIVAAFIFVPGGINMEKGGTAESCSGKRNLGITFWYIKWSATRKIGYIQQQQQQTRDISNKTKFTFGLNLFNTTESINPQNVIYKLINAGSYTKVSRENLTLTDGACNS